MSRFLFENKSVTIKITIEGIPIDNAIFTSLFNIFSASDLLELLITILSNTASISLILPIQIYLIFDIIGIITAFSLYSPKIKYISKDIKNENIFSQLKKLKGTGFYTISLFLALISGVVFGISPYKEPFIKALGFPIIFIGLISALSRIIWFIIGNNLKYLKRILFSRLLFYEMIFFPLALILSSQLKNPYIIVIVLAIVYGYYHARTSIIDEYYLNNFVLNKRYKATLLSFRSQIDKLFQSIFTFGIGFIIVKSYSIGFLVSGVGLLIVLLIIYPFVKKTIDRKSVV